jgi:hypothetical protein
MKPTPLLGAALLVATLGIGGAASAEGIDIGRPPPSNDGPPPVAAAPTDAPAPNDAPRQGGGYGPKQLRYRDGDLVPSGYHVESHVRTGLVIGGSITFGVPYLLTVASASGATASDAKLCYVPVAGPILYSNTLHGDFAFIGQFFLWMDALAQAAGATMLIVGVAAPKDVLVRNDLATVHLAPMVARGTTGLVLAGTF